MHGERDCLAKPQPHCAPAADHKASSYSAPSAAVPGGLRACLPTATGIWLVSKPARGKTAGGVTLQVSRRTKMHSTIKS